MSQEDKSEIIERFETGVLCRDFSGRLTYEINGFPAESYKSQKKALAKKFGLLPIGITVNGPDEAFQTFAKGLKRIGIEWDIWSGFSVVAKSESAEELVKEIGQHLEQTIKI